LASGQWWAAIIKNSSIKAMRLLIFLENSSIKATNLIKDPELRQLVDNFFYRFQNSGAMKRSKIELPNFEAMKRLT
jgi:hypothetical protein